MRYFIDLMYDGSAYHGWQSQKNALSVQDVVEDAMEKILGLHVETVGSGRTDTGVHALQQIAHFDVSAPFDPPRIRNKLNSFLPRDIAIRKIWKVPPGSHARFDAVRRCYEYRIVTEKDPFLIQNAYYFRRPVDLDRMNEATELILTARNFQSFSRVKTEVNHFICHVFDAVWEKAGEMIIFSVCADRFLRGMVRALAGTLFDVGTGKISVDGFGEIIGKKDRKAAGRSLPAHGLYLKSVSYPDQIYEFYHDEQLTGLKH